MKKVLSVILVIVLIAGVWTPSALAQTPEGDLPRPVLPNGIPEENRPPIPDQPGDIDIILGEGEFRFSDTAAFLGAEDDSTGELIISVQERQPDGSYTRIWDAAAEGGTAPYYYQFYMVLPTYINGKWIYYAKGQQSYSTESSYAFTFQYDGEYQLWVDVRDSSGRSTRVIQPVPVTGLDVQPLTIQISEPSGDFFTENAVIRLLQFRWNPWPEP